MNSRKAGGILLMLLAGGTFIEAANQLMLADASMHTVNVFGTEFLLIGIMAYYGLRLYRKGSQTKP